MTYLIFHQIRYLTKLSECQNQPPQTTARGRESHYRQRQGQSYPIREQQIPVLDKGGFGELEAGSQDVKQG